MGSISEWGPTYCVSFDVKILSWKEKYQRIFRISKGEDKDDGIGTRYPAVWVQDGNREQLHFSTSIDTNWNWVKIINFEKNKWYHITISQKLNMEVNNLK